jgi:SAM-dependent methyltransferase
VPVQQTAEADWEEVFTRITHGHAPPAKQSLEASVEEGQEFLDRGITAAHADVLDLGCGNGRQLIGLLNQNLNSYVGLDPVRESIEFCNRELTSRIEGAQFTFLDVYNEYYNPSGSMPPNNVVLPFPDASFDCVLTGSVFTHLATIEISARHLSEIARVLKPGGRLFSSWFRNPPNVLSDNSHRSVYPEGDILNILTKDFHIYGSRGGFMGEFHDQWCLFSVKKH